MSFLNRVCTALSARNIPYAIVGGFAVALHGAVRGTVDVDVAITWSQQTLLSTEQALNDIGLTSRLPITAKDVFRFRNEYIENRNLIGWNFHNPQNPAEQVDIVINYDLNGKKPVTVNTLEGQVKILG